MNPTALFKYGVGTEDVRAALSAANANSPKGAVEDALTHWQVYSNDQARTAAQYRLLIVAYRNGAPIRLSDVADVQDSVEDLRTLGLSRDKPAVLVVINREPGANIIETVDSVRALLPELKNSIRGGAGVEVVVDRSKTIRASLRDIEISLLISIALVVLVVMVFLRDPRAALVPSVAVPISLIGTCGAMYLLGFSLDNLSLMALTVATGFVVDDAIVVMENIVRHMEAGMPRFKATLLGVREVGFTVVSMSMSLIAVFLPVLFMGGQLGPYLREFAVTLSVAIVFSMVISLTTTPMMCSRILGDHGRRGPGRFHRWFEAVFNDLRRSYERSLAWVLLHGRLTLLVLACTVGLNFLLFASIPRGFFPEQDTGRLMGFIQADQSISFQLISKKLKQFIDIIQADPAVSTAVGYTGGGSSNSGFMFIELKPLSERGVSAEQVMARLRPKLGKVAGASLFLIPPQDIRIGGRQSNSLYQYTLQADELSDLRAWMPKLVDALKTEPILTDVNSDQQDKGLETDITIDRDTASRLGLTASQVDNTLYDAFGQRQVSTIYQSLNQYHVVMVVNSKYWQDPQALANIYVSTSGGAVTGTQSSNAVAGTVKVGTARAGAATSVAADAARNASLNAIATTGHGAASTGQAVSTNRETMVPLSSFTRYGMGTTPLAVNHQGQFVAGTISFNLAPDGSLSDAVDAVNRQIARIHMPGSIHGSFQGTAGTFEKALGNESDPHPGRHRRDLHCAGRPLRELRPSPHDPLDPSVGRHRRRPGAHAVQCGIQRHRADRRLPPHRHRQEKRDHDDRLRHRGRKKRGPEPQGRHLQGEPAPLPAHPHDHPGGHAGRCSPCDRLRGGFRTPAPPWNLNRRGIDRQPTAHALHDPRGVPVHRPRAPLDGEVAAEIRQGPLRGTARAGARLTPHGPSQNHTTKFRRQGDSGLDSRRGLGGISCRGLRRRAGLQAPRHFGAGLVQGGRRLEAGVPRGCRPAGTLVEGVRGPRARRTGGTGGGPQFFPAAGRLGL